MGGCKCRFRLALKDSFIFSIHVLIKYYSPNMTKLYLTSVGIFSPYLHRKCEQSSRMTH